MNKFLKILPGLILVVLIGLVAIDYSNFRNNIDIMGFSEDPTPSTGIHLGDPEPQIEFLKEYKTEKHEYHTSLNMGKEVEATEQGYNISLSGYYPPSDFCVCHGRTHIKVSRGEDVRDLDSIGLMSYLISDDSLYLETDDWIIYKIDLNKLFASSVYELWRDSRYAKLQNMFIK